MFPIVQVKVLGMVALNEIFGEFPLQNVAVKGVVTEGAGLTVTVRLKGVPGHELTIDVGVTRYTTVPVVELLGLIKT